MSKRTLPTFKPVSVGLGAEDEQGRGCSAWSHSQAPCWMPEEWLGYYHHCCRPRGWCPAAGHAGSWPHSGPPATGTCLPGPGAHQGVPASAQVHQPLEHLQLDLKKKKVKIKLTAIKSCFFFVYLFVLRQIGSYYTIKDGLGLTILLSQPPKSWTVSWDHKVAQFVTQHK